MISAIGTKLVIEKIEVEQTTQFGIVLSNSTDPNPRGKIISVGSEVQVKEPALTPDSTVIVEWRNTAVIKDQGKDYYVVDLSSVYGVVV
jgi:co-chaperonin GroES (HSP10)